MKYALAVLLALAATASVAQVPLPLGTVTNVQSETCPTGFTRGSQCYAAVVTCGSLSLPFNYGIYSPTIPAVGTIVAVNGGGDTVPAGAPLYANAYKAAGQIVEEFDFPVAWETGGNLQVAACLPATVLSYLNLNPTLPYGVQAMSAGAGAVAYAMSWYGVHFDAVEMMSGPVFARVDLGCETPWASSQWVVPTNGAPYYDMLRYNQEWQQVTIWAGEPCLPHGGSTAQQLSALAAESIVQAGEIISFPTTAISGWVCNNGVNPSAAQAYLWFSGLTSSYNLTAITNCAKPTDEGVSNGYTPQGELGSAAIIADMLANNVIH